MVFPVGSLGSAAVLAADPTRIWHRVRVARPSTFVGKLMSNTALTRTGALHVSPPSPELTTISWFSAGVLKFSNEAYTRPPGATVGYESWSSSHSPAGPPPNCTAHAELKPLISLPALQLTPSSECETMMGERKKADVPDSSISLHVT